VKKADAARSRFFLDRVFVVASIGASGGVVVASRALVINMPAKEQPKDSVNSDVLNQADAWLNPPVTIVHVGRIF
jgi:hypothetical protein